MSPYYTDDKVTLYHGDCFDILDHLAGDVLVSDVPYGIDYRSNQRRQTLARSIAGDKDTAARDGVLEWWGDKPALIFGTWRIPRPAATRQLLVWDTKGALGMGVRLTCRGNPRTRKSTCSGRVSPGGGRRTC